MEGCTLKNYKLMQFALGYKKGRLTMFLVKENFRSDVFLSWFFFFFGEGGGHLGLRVKEIRVKINKNGRSMFKNV